MSPWRCPTCTTIIKHDDLKPKPSAGVRYRCHVCRLGLRYDDEADVLIIVHDDDTFDRRGAARGGRDRRRASRSKHK
jgi:hypothetical protein